MRKVSDRVAQDRTRFPSRVEQEFNAQATSCPPHDFRQGWLNNDHGVIYCRLCGVRIPLDEE